MSTPFLKASAILVTVMAAGAEIETPSVEGSEKQTVRFRNGVNGYSATVDTEIWAVSPHACLEGNPNASSDGYNDGGESQVLVRFGDVIGDKPGQVPSRSTVHRAKLIISAFDQGTTVHLHRVLVPWKRTATWASLVGGITADGLEASAQKDGFTFGKISASTSEIPFEVTDTVQAWVNGAGNHGWVFINTGGNGWDFYTSNAEQSRHRPVLIIEFTPLKN